MKYKSKNTYSTNVLQRIKDIMHKDNISVAELSRRLKSTHSATSSLLRQDNISINKLQDICSVLGYRLDIDIIKDNNTTNNDTGITPMQLQHILAYAQKVMQADSSVDVSGSIDTSVSADSNGKDGKDI